MGLISLQGNMILKEEYGSPRDGARYYAVLTGIARAAEMPPKAVAPEFKIEIPITREQYESFKKDIEASTAEWPCFKFKGDLETFVNFFSLA